MPSLIWKEWREQNWKLALGVLLLGAMAVMGLHARIFSDEDTIIWVGFVAMVLLPTVISSGLVPAERGEGTFESLLAIPISPWRILLAKTVTGLCLCVGPMLSTLLLSCLIVNGREITNGFLIEIFIRYTLTIVSLFVWMLALTARMPSETRAGLVSVGALIFWILATIGLTNAPHPSLWSSISPMSFIFGFSEKFANSPPIIYPLIVQAVVAIALWAWTSRQIIAPVEGRS